MTSPIVLLTDFGLRDPYVGQMKGVILGIAPEARIVDLTHDVPPQDVGAAARILQESWTYFPEHTVFVSVVDPGVGTDRACLCVGAEMRWFLAPDNGLLGFLQEEERIDCAFRIENRRLMLPEVSSTFHGRDIFAPVAAHLAGELDVAELGPVVDRIVEIDEPRPTRLAAGTMLGEVVHVDRFGNLITNVEAQHLRTLVYDMHGSAPLEACGLFIEAGEHSVGVLERTYGSVPSGTSLALIGSSGRLEVAVNGGSAAQALGLAVGTPVRIVACAPAAPALRSGRDREGGPGAAKP